MAKHLVIAVEMTSGNVAKTSRHFITSAIGASRIKPKNGQIWMTRETAVAIGANIETFWGTLPNGSEIQIKTEKVICSCS